MFRYFKIISLFIVISAILLSCSIDTSGASREEIKLQQIKNELYHQKRKLRITKQKERTALQKLYIIKNLLKKAQNKMDVANSSISRNRKRITILTKDLNTYRKSLSIKSKNLRHRIREVYKSGGISLFEVVFGSISMADFLNRAYYFGRLIQSDVVLIKDIREDISKINRAKIELDSSNREISRLVNSVNQQKASIQQTKKNRERIYNVLKSRRIEYEKHVAKLEESSKEFEKLIRRVAADKKRKGIVTQGTGRFTWPLRGRLVSKFGYRRHPIWGGYHLHTGIDIAAPYGRPIKASDQGEVIYSGWWNGYGKAVVIDHGRGYTTVYGHMSRIYVRAGQSVEQGQFVGLVGSTGFSTGPHLHFEVRKNGRPVNPLRYI